MVSEEYIELPLSPCLDNGGGNNTEEVSMVQEINKENCKMGGEEDNGLNEDGSKDALDGEETDKDRIEGNCILKDDNQGRGNEMQQDLNLHLKSSSIFAADEYELSQMKSDSLREDGSALVGESEAIIFDTTSRSGVKRARVSYIDDQPSVHVIYNYLPRESKKKLAELLQNWSEWHSQYFANAKNSIEESLECGDEIYFPALQVGGGNTSMTYWMDKPTKQNLKEGTKDQLSQEKEEGVPYYDRACTLPLTIQNGIMDPECIEELPAEASRCFNCGSYSHGLKDCSKPRDNTAITNARNEHKSKRAQASGPRCPQRYYQNSPGGKFEGIKPGMLGSETRQSLGIGELDPPPWLNRMRELGYPPGYLDSDNPDEPSGIVIYADDENMELEEEGEFIESDFSKPSEIKRMTVPFPGINAPIPENADERLWSGSNLASDDPNMDRKADGGHIFSSPGSSSMPGRGSRFNQARSRDYNSLPDEPPGTERVGNNASGNDFILRGRGPNSTPSPNYSSESQQSKMRYPSLTRSASDSGRRTPHVLDNSRSMHIQGMSPRYSEHGRSPYGQYSPHSPVQYSSSSPGRYSSQVYSPGNTDYVPSERRHGLTDSYSSQKKERSDGSRYHRR
ncbi:hypothetical protein SUGI_0182780 [Cryptomeria japonica]|uniref:uncharacterized protein LOC131050912 n=1 Tax=Cryptomeria japonica TaxID=3369 RepID=UPI002408D63D|nr:uncharacterized protein LOC131050912 [Cryptomeria japonica]XP_057841220.1 uncharacterized protein LOC131050912 [Cryptomeria japonica]GLJ12046.1 hypothetical protein SUGI_0182780 [Cryptomeria japonica]